MNLNQGMLAELIDQAHHVRNLENGLENAREELAEFAERFAKEGRRESREELRRRLLAEQGAREQWGAGD